LKFKNNSMKIIYRNIIPFIVIALAGCNHSISYKDGIILEEFIFDQAPFPSCHASTIAETPEGLIAAWFGGTRERHPDVGIWISRNENGKWSKPEEITNGVINDTLRYPCWNPVLFRIPDGDLLLFYKVGPSPSAWWGMMMRSDDHGKTWNEPQKLPEGYIGPVKNKPVLLDNGNLICPSSTEGNGWKVHFEITPDFGLTWKTIGPINDGSTYNAIQPCILKHKNGMLQVLCRSQNAVIAGSWSKDNGQTWSLLQASGLPNNNSGIDAVTLADGRHLVVYNHVKTPVNAKKGYRTPLNVAVSKDGINWYAALILEDSEISQYSYPSVIQSSDGLVHVVYTWRRERIKHVKIDPDKLKLKKITDEKWPL
jgi:predicted neuraminidase